MTSKMQISSARWRDWAMLVLGGWLVLSPWWLGYMSVAPVADEQVAAVGFALPALNAWIVGAAVAILAIWAIYDFAKWQDWVNGFLGVWLVFSPWLLDFTTTMIAVSNHAVVGVLVVVLAAWELWDARHRSFGAPA